ncbi:uncharacterized protein LOC141639781 [Silene latifolia]|uniref:uncharacterized protein LOC141639781 n=1 Tax=Silene latifolia TaxID=37657 RepID=UPI003D78AAC5
MVCVQSQYYSLVLNGESFGFFKGAKGLRQGDPLSPLLFTIAIEYLSRILHYTTSIMPFRYHPLCGRLKLYHLMFADDLLLFSKGDVQSIMVLLISFATFSKATRLQMNTTKSNIYLNGVKNSVKDDIPLISCFTEGTLPFRYLGVPITAGRLNKKDSQALIDKVAERIRGFVLKAVDNICRNFLWDGNSECMRVPPVAWEKICCPKSEGGLGIRDSKARNTTAIRKLLVLKKKTALSGTKCRLGSQMSLRLIKVTRFNSWMVARNALMVKHRLFDLGISSDDLCLLCGLHTETHNHLFQGCQYSNKIIAETTAFIHLQVPSLKTLGWIQKRSRTSTEKDVVLCALMNAHYSIWMR